MRTFSTSYPSDDKADRRHLFDGLSKIDLPSSQLTTKSLPAVIMPILISKRVSIDNNNDNGCIGRVCTRKRIVRSVVATVTSYRPFYRYCHCHRHGCQRLCYSSFKNACNNAANFLHALITPRKYAS